MKKIQRFNALLLVGFIYFLLAAGTFTAYEYIPEYYFPFGILSTGMYAYFLFKNIKYIKLTDIILIFKCILPFAIVYMAYGFNALDSALYFKRIEGAFIVTLTAATLMVMVIKRVGYVDFLKYIIAILTIILLITLFYKLMFGFWDRGVRFFINGPIVFSWFMGFGVLIVLQLKKINSIGTKITYVLVFAFSCAMAWTESKGPAIILLFILFVIFCKEFKEKIEVGYRGICMMDRNLEGSANLNAKFIFENFTQGYITFKFMLIVIMSFVLVSVFTPSGALDRFLIIIFANNGGGLANVDDVGGVVNHGTGGVNYGSVGIRIDMWKLAWKLFVENLYIGVGPTNWGLYSGMVDLIYPHNIFLEVASELGLTGLLALLFILINVWIKTTYLGRITILYFLSGCMLSGDISYLRLVLALPIALVVLRNSQNI